MNTEILKISSDIKVKLFFCLSFFITYITPIHGLIYIVGTAVIIDTCFGLYSAIKKKIPIQSNLLLNIVVKTFFYMGSILLGFLVSEHITDGELFDIKYFVPKFLCGMWVFIEAKSMDETNVKLGNRPFLNIIKDLIKGLKSLKKDINELK